MPGRKPLRIFAIPLAHLKSSPTPLIYYHVSQRTPITPSEGSSTTPPTTAESPSSTVLTKPAVLAGFDYAQPSSWPDFLTHRASQFWLSFSQTQQEGPLYKTWKYKTWRNGERLMDKIEYEEWGLKNIDTGRDAWTGLKVVNKPEQTTSSEGEAEGRENGVDNGKEEIKPKEKLLLIHPPLLTSSSPLSLLRTHLITRIPYHRQLLIRSSYLIPVLLPIGLLPVVPNLPMFYVIWRMWSHWKAKRGAEYLLKLVEEGNVVEKESGEFGRILDGNLRTAGDEKAPDQTSSEGVKEVIASPEVETSNEKMVLDGVPTSEKVDEAPDSTGTPKQMIYRSQDESASDSGKSTVSSSSIPSTTSSVTPSTAASTPPPSSSSSSTSTSSSKPHSDKIIFPRSAIPIVAQTFELSPPEIVDLTRAVEQAGLRVRKEEKEEMEG